MVKKKSNRGARIKSIYNQIKDTIDKQIWLEVLFMAGIGVVSSIIVFLIVSHAVYSAHIGTREYFTYNESKTHTREWMLNNVARLNELGTETKEDGEQSLEESIREILYDANLSTDYTSESKSYIVDSSGKLLYGDEMVESINLIKVIQKANQNEYSTEENKFVAIYPVIVNDKVCYLYNESVLEPVYHMVYTDFGNILGFLAAVGAFIFIIFRLTKEKISYLEYLSECLGEISKGDLNYKIDMIGHDELAQVAQAITHMEEEIKYQVDAKIKTEQSKNELVTNVAHDLRTPLTSIIGYIGLAKSGEYHSQEELDKYLEIAYNKSEKLKVLIEDLFELTKLHQHSVKLNMKTISLSNLLNQLIEEMMPLASDRQIEIESYIDTNDTFADVDVDKITRVFENLIQNAIKYCPEGETIYIELRSGKKHIYAAVSNPAEKMPQDEIDKFFERFYRADKSRNSNAGGSGLGLAIAKNIVLLHGGKIKAGLNQDLISFKVTLPRKQISPEGDKDGEK